MRLSIQLLSLSLCILPYSLALFADEAYEIDYQHSLLGVPQQSTTFFHRPRKDDKASLLYTLSESGVLGAVNPGTGAIKWRQYLAGNSNRTFGGENGAAGFLRAAEGEGTVVSAVDGIVRAWDARSGREAWYNEFGGSVRDLEVMETAGDEKYKDSLVLFEEAGKGVVRRLSGENGDVVWEHTLDGSDVPFQISTNVKHVFVVSLHGSWGGYNLKITTLDPLKGGKLEEHTLASKSDVQSAEDVIFVGANIAAPILAWTNKSLKSLKVNILGTSKIHSLPLGTPDETVEKVSIHAPHLIQSQPHFLVHSQSAVSHWADVYHIDLVAGTVAEAYHLPRLPGKGAFSTSSQDANVYFTRHTIDETIVVDSTSHGVLARYAVEKFKGGASAVHAVSEVVVKGSAKAGVAKTYAVRSAIVTSEDDWDLLRNGAPAWTRPEGLAGVVAAAWAEIPESQSLVKTLELEAHSNPLSAYIHRVKRHVNDLQYLPDFLQSLPKKFLSSIIADSSVSDGGLLVRDTFGFRKLVIAATERGRIYALDTANQGKVVWSRKAFEISSGEKWDVRGIYVDNIKGQATIRGHLGEHCIFKTDTGADIESLWRGSVSHVQSTALIDSPSGPLFLSVGEDGKPGELPSEKTPSSGIVVRGKNGDVKGLTYVEKDGTSTPQDSWVFQAPTGQRILSVTARSLHDPVANIGRALGDRTVLYKYLNPNTILVTTVSDALATASIFLLDTVSGEILYSTTHESVDVTRSIPSVITENWFAYSLWADLSTDRANAKSTTKGNQIFISDLYESHLANDRGPLSSSANYSAIKPSDLPLGEPALPYVKSAAFFVPEPISHLTVTQTRQGITTRQILCTLANSNAIVAIDRFQLDPRRPVGRDATAHEAEEGLSKYDPVIAFDPKMTITHKREVMGIRNVITTPALLESTTLVFAYGVDVFGTRLMPSMAFDVLGKDFNRVSLVATVAALAVGVGALAPMVRRKLINERWQVR